MEIDLTMLNDMEPWEWPEGSRQAIKKVLHDQGAPVEERMLAAELGGDLVVMDDEMAGLLVSIVSSAEEPAKVRERAAISLGPVLEECDMDGFDDPYVEPTVTEATFLRIQKALRAVHDQRSAPKDVRRRALEAAVRAEGDWQRSAIREAYRSSDPEWKLTAVFCMQYVEGFDGPVMEALKSKDSELHREAVRTAGARNLERAWPHVRNLLLADGEGDKDLLLTAIAAAGEICPEDEREVIEELLDSEDEDVVEAARDAIETLDIGGGDWDGDLEEEDEDDR